jgi:hypothetical protein
VLTRADGFRFVSDYPNAEAALARLLKSADVV